MPELPEVETLVSDLRPQLAGRRITGCGLRLGSIVRHPAPDAFVPLVTGRTIATVQRRGKYIVCPLDDGTLLVVHLGMTGHLRLHEPEEEPAPHVHALFDLDSGAQLRYRDPRRFGRILLGREVDLLAARQLPRLGPEPLDGSYRSRDLAARLRGRRAPVKALLLDQSVVAGIGNIYADEALFRARLRPDRPAGTLSRGAVARLHASLREALAEAVANRGSSVNSYLDAFGERGTQQEVLRVYGRGGRPCRVCGRTLETVRIGGRTTVFCRRCQR